MPDKLQIQPPEHLTTRVSRDGRRIVDDYQLEPHHVRLLTLAAEAWERCQDARAILDREGAIYRDRFGAPRKHPAVSIEENARIAFACLVRERTVEEVPAPDSRPPRARR